jgi:2'-5' RNA ligase
MVDAGYQPDERLFRGHLTLCRLDTEERKQPKALPISAFTLPAISVRSVALFRSEKIADTYEYTLLDRFHARHVC